jgi:hypothetical protein
VAFTDSHSDVGADTRDGGLGGAALGHSATVGLTLGMGKFGGHSPGTTAALGMTPGLVVLMGHCGGRSLGATTPLGLTLRLVSRLGMTTLALVAIEVTAGAAAGTTVGPASSLKFSDCIIVA